MCSSHITLTLWHSLCQFTEKHFYNYKFISVSILNVLYYKKHDPNKSWKQLLFLQDNSSSNPSQRNRKSHKASLEQKWNLIFFRLFPNFRSSTLKIQSLKNIIARSSSEKDFMSDRLLLKTTCLNTFVDFSPKFSLIFLDTNRQFQNPMYTKNQM